MGQLSMSEKSDYRIAFVEPLDPDVLKLDISKPDTKERESKCRCIDCHIMITTMCCLSLIPLSAIMFLLL